MGVRVEFRLPIEKEYPEYCKQLLAQLFAVYELLLVTKEFTEGQSGTYVFLVEPQRENASSDLPFVVKIGADHLITEEWKRTQKYVVQKLPGFVPIMERPVSFYLPADNGYDLVYSAAKYSLAADGIFEIDTLRGYAANASAQDLYTLLEKCLFVQLERIWRRDAQHMTRSVGASYDRVLPVNLLLKAEPLLSAAATKIDATQIISFPFLAKKDDNIELVDFAVTEIDHEQQTLTLNVPLTDTVRATSFRVRVQDVADLHHYHIGQIVESLFGRVSETRQSLLLQALTSKLDSAIDLTAPEIRLSNIDPLLPNPLLRWPDLSRNLCKKANWVFLSHPHKAKRS